MKLSRTPLGTATWYCSRILFDMLQFAWLAGLVLASDRHLHSSQHTDSVLGIVDLVVVRVV